MNITSPIAPTLKAALGATSTDSVALIANLGQATASAVWLVLTS